MTLVIIPARMGSTRLPGKPLLKIGDKTIIQRCILQAVKAGFEPYVATDSPEIVEHIKTGANYILTGECNSGTDRVAAAAEIIDPDGKHEFVINYQGDMPFLDPEDLKRFVEFRERSEADIVTACCLLEFVACDPWFRRRHTNTHIGLYGFTRKALRVFASIEPSDNEKYQRLEQCRATDMSWEFTQLPSMPIEINTQADLDRARSCLM